MLKSEDSRLYGFRSRAGFIRPGSGQRAKVAGLIDVVRKLGALALLAVLALVIETGSAQAALTAPDGLRGMGRFLSNNPLLVFAIILALVLVLGRCLDYLRQARERRSGLSE